MTAAIGAVAGGEAAGGAAAGAGAGSAGGTAAGGGARAAGGRAAAGKSGPKHAKGGQRGRDAMQVSDLGVGMLAGRGSGGGKKKKASGKPGMRSPANRALVAEFVICIIILALSPLTGKEPTPKDWMKKGTAMCGLFMALGMTSSVGPRTGRAMAAFGFLVTLALLVNQRSVFVKIAEKFGGGNTPAGDQGPP